MPFANFKVPAEQKELIVHRTGLYAETYGEKARPNTMVLIEEVTDGGWGIGHRILTLAMIQGSEAAATLNKPCLSQRPPGCRGTRHLKRGVRGTGVEAHPGQRARRILAWSQGRRRASEFGFRSAS
jgi:4-oxalocrotonate tautomerase